MTRRLLLPALAILLSACAARKKEPRFDYGKPQKTYTLKGVVLRLRQEDRVATIKHEKIEGWMEAMTMDFPVPDQAEFGKLKEDAAFRATVNVNDMHYWLTAITLE